MVGREVLRIQCAGLTPTLSIHHAKIVFGPSVGWFWLVERAVGAFGKMLRMRGLDGRASVS